jgi:hypothetical protein
MRNYELFRCAWMDGVGRASRRYTRSAQGQSSYSMPSPRAVRSSAFRRFRSALGVIPPEGGTTNAPSLLAPGWTAHTRSTSRLTPAVRLSACAVAAGSGLDGPHLIHQPADAGPFASLRSPSPLAPGWTAHIRFTSRLTPGRSPRKLIWPEEVWSATVSRLVPRLGAPPRQNRCERSA